MRAGRYDEALWLASRITELEPEFAMSYATQGWAYLLSGKPDQGIASLERASALEPKSTVILAQLGQAYARVGRTQEAREVLRRLKERAAERCISLSHGLRRRGARRGRDGDGLAGARLRGARGGV
jgi:predicted Zn-dependent protease